MTTEELRAIIAGSRNGILATVGRDATPQLSNIYYLADPHVRFIRFSTTTTRTKGRNLLRTPRASLHVAGEDFFHYAVVEGATTFAIASSSDGVAIDELFEVHSALGAVSDREGFGEAMVAAGRMLVQLEVVRLYGFVRNHS
ncbi:MAG TPA: TIGR03618 family F420-dependent PPOX class oxidoreductase [Acidimicrobiales bacterium]|nr:TIGR03618 family F420-dependent PPOX class oxidoreductase [Acidimicrobiales bacterium]